MSTTLKVAGFLVGLVAVFGIAMGVGNAVDPVVSEPPAGHVEHAARTGVAAGDESLPGGLMVSQDGFTLVTVAQAEPGRDVPVTFTITGPDGEPVTSYDVQHEKRLHLIAVRRDFTGFQHVHPELDGAGVWRTDLDLSPGQWRLFADFEPTGAEALTLGTDLAVAGTPVPAAAGGESRTAHVDGYAVTLDGDVEAGADARLTLSVSKDGRPVTDLQPYLGAYGHLVALREGDLAYLHVHPDGTPGDGSTEPGPDVVFYAGVPSTGTGTGTGTYRLYLDFRHEGVVRTAAFTITTTGAAEAPSAPHDDGGNDDH